jgi:hypothetical protein
VERPFYYLEEHFIKGNSWPDFEALARDLATFTTEELDQRVHATTGESPLQRFTAERDSLISLPPLPFIGTHELMRKVSWDGLVAYAGSRYSVPSAYANKQVWLRPSQGRHLVVRSQDGQEIARHTLTAGKRCTVLIPSHYEALRRGTRKSRTLLEQDFLHRFPEAQWFLEALFIQHKNNGLHHLRAILSLADLYPAEVLVFAFEQARTYNTYSQAFIRGLLEAGVTSAAPATGPVSPLPLSTVGADLQVYQRLLEVAP